MTIEIDSPATLLDIADIHGCMSPLVWDICREMRRNGRTWSLRIDGDLIGVFGTYGDEKGAEAWFAVRPAASRHMLFLCRQIRLTLASLDYPEIVVFCETEAGRRIAALCGFQFAAHFEQREIWRYGKSDRRGVAEEGPGTPAAAGAGAAAATAG
ncbi:hypothetical protein FNA46_07835 [Rhizobium straminoryzae]|uniref:GNAT family N-acetyltransferase n=2 Tax=Rhizobium straminoryzae TaxID=1387186 RepID=A0A549TD31_9HYPH|nr:hypothetical protein FNA46_07835 [Rhizobium straminoryzae]